jgi:hypothetical protein
VENEKSVLCNQLDGKAFFTGMLRLYAAIHREMEDSLLPVCAQRKVEENIEKEIATLTTVAA